MKTSIKYIFTGFILLIAFSCNNDFLNDKPGFSIDASVLSDIYVSPDWEATECHIQCYGAGNAKFSIVNAPQWLNISQSGQFNKDTAIVTCSANTYSEFSGVGIYNSIMTIDIQGRGKVAVPVAYVIEGNPVIECASNLTLSNYNGASVPLVIKNNGNGILIWNIVECPDWIQINSGLPVIENHVVASYSERTIEVLVDVWKLMDADTMNGRIVLVSNGKNQPVTVVNLTFGGNPSIHFYTNEIDFGRSSVTQNLAFANYGDGYLEWEIEKCPEWITVSKSKGVLFPSHGTDITLACDRNRLPAGENSAVITLKTNDRNNPAYAITVKCRTGNNPENVKPIEGKIVGVCSDIQKDLLYILTNQPNQLQVYDMKIKTVTQAISFNKTPNCFKLSEDGGNLLIGQSGMISCIDVKNLTVTKQIDVDISIFDIEWGADAWICYTPGISTQHYNLSWINLNTNEKYETPYDPYSGLYGGTILKKIPNKNYLIASRLQISPSGIIMFDITKKEFKNYIHETIGKFWYSADGDYLFDEWSAVYKTSALLSNTDIISAPVVNRLNFNSSSYNQIAWVDMNISTKNLWVLPADNNYYNSNPVIYQFNTEDFSLIKSYYYDEYYHTTISGKPDNYQVAGHYLFSNHAGTEIIVVKNISEYYGIHNNWSIEHIPATN
jgi:hypothetical protein